MEFFNKAKAVKLRSHLGKYLVADADQEKVRQSRNGWNQNTKWIVELVDGKTHFMRLKSIHGRYLTATDVPYLLGMTGEKVAHADFDKGLDWKYEWEPIRDGFQVKLRSWCGKYLRANGGTPPWRNSITHDDPHATSTRNWILWEVESVELPQRTDSYEESVLSSRSSGNISGSEPPTPMSVSPVNSSMRTSISQISSNKFRLSMDLFHNAKVVRLRSHHDKYLLADEDEESVVQDRNGSSKNARWIVEYVPGYDNIIRLKSSYDKYLTASNQPFLLGMTGRKVLQTLPHRLDSSVEWEPVRDGARLKLKTRYGNFLRANGGLPPWRNSVTHDIPHRTATQDWILWDVDVLEIHVSCPGQKPTAPPVPHSDSLNFESDTPSAVPVKSADFSRQESTDSNVGSPPKMEGRTIYYHIAEDNGEVDDEDVQGYSLIFKGSGVEELTSKFKEETGLEDVIVCTRSPLNGKLYPLRLQLPPNNVTMHIILVLPSSKLARDFEEQGLL